MRISTNTIYTAQTANLAARQEQLFQTQQQISRGKRLLTPSTDPSATTQVLALQQSNALETQYTANRGSAIDTLSLTEGVLQQVTNLIQNAQSSVIYAGNGALNAQDLNTLSQSISAAMQDILHLANSQDSQGKYLFSGFQTQTQPFSPNSAGMTYSGDDGAKLVTTSHQSTTQINYSGNDLFMRIKDGNGTFVTTASPLNTGSGTANIGSVINPTFVTHQPYNIQFSNSASGALQYTITNTSTGLPTPNASPQHYTDSSAISFDGITLAISGTPSPGDQFSVTHSTHKSLFDTLSNIATSLTTKTGTALTSDLQKLGVQLGNALSVTLNARSDVGLKLNALDAAQSMGDSFSLQNTGRISQLQDTDLAQAISALTQQQSILQIAQKAFAQTSQLSLFNYI